ncbi:hypothetical protein Tco_0629850 [Tanacetum coccineum]|uniref:Cathepsin propeptide inhibitor domain-containing protein n=1 Tax=Tanacetum coccineum TaxID=301880 RepID=A0ABQ4WUD7_9ASTR
MRLPNLLHVRNLSLSLDVRTFSLWVWTFPFLLSPRLCSDLPAFLTFLSVLVPCSWRESSDFYWQIEYGVSYPTEYGVVHDKEFNEQTNTLITLQRFHEREFRSSKKHFKSLSLDELRSSDFNLLSDKEYSEEEEAMAETMEQYMSKTRTDYESGVARPKIDNKDQFELKGQFLKEHRENTF